MPDFIHQNEIPLEPIIVRKERVQALSIPTPTTEEMKADLDLIYNYKSFVHKRKNETAKRREAMEQPLAATIP